jgi:hypothetical protein
MLLGSAIVLLLLAILTNKMQPCYYARFNSIEMGLYLMASWVLLIKNILDARLWSDIEIQLLGVACTWCGWVGDIDDNGCVLLPSLADPTIYGVSRK